MEKKNYAIPTLVVNLFFESPLIFVLFFFCPRIRFSSFDIGHKHSTQVKILSIFVNWAKARTPNSCKYQSIASVHIKVNNLILIFKV